MAKRLFDCICSILGVAILCPVFLLVAVAIKIDSKGPVFYKGVRAGRRGHPFRIFKFRSMVENAEAIGGASTPEDDTRVTRLGRFLRQTKLDELPQLLNVIKGDMSLVGPRPQFIWAVEQYTPEERTILDIRPGITDLASVRFRNESEILRGSTNPDKDYFETIHPEKMRLSLEYVRRRSFWLDCKILLQTLRAILLAGDSFTLVKK